MVLEYNLVNSDIVEFLVYHNFDAPAKKSVRIKTRLSIILIFIFILIMFKYIPILEDAMSPYIGLVWFLGSGYTIWFLLSLNTERANFFHKILKELSQLNKNALIRHHKIEITESYISIKTENSETKYTFDKIVKLISTQNYFFIYDSAVSAIIIPKNQINRNEISEVENIVNNRLKINFS